MSDAIFLAIGQAGSKRYAAIYMTDRVPATARGTRYICRRAQYLTRQARNCYSLAENCRGASPPEDRFGLVRKPHS